jgi:hypothetical protein
MRMYAWLGVLVLLIFSWCVSGDCYFSAATYRVAAWSMVVFAMLGMLLFTRFLRRNHYTLQMRAGPRRLTAVEIPFHVVMMGSLFGWMSWLAFYALLSLLVFASSRTPSSMLTRLEVSHTGGRCGTSYAFYDPFLQRRVDDCGLPYRGARSGDNVSVTLERGPLGMHLDRVKRQP